MTLQHLDSVIAFAVVLLGLSLLITVGTQIAISLLGLRGANLRRSLADLFETACPDRDARRYGKEIASRVLRHPLISDSVFSRFCIRAEKLPFVPTDAAGKLQWAAGGIPFRPWLMGAVGGFFAWPIALVTIKHLFFPDICKFSDLLASYVPVLNLCGHPWRSGALVGAVFTGLLSRWRLATSIRVEELVATLEKLSEPLDGTLPDPVQRAMLVIAGEAQSEPHSKLKQVSARFERPIQETPDFGHGGVAVAVEEAVAQIPAPVESRLEGLKSWFGPAMDRASQRFTLQARVVTVMLSVIFVFAGHLDAIRLFQTLSSDAQLRAELAGSADAMIKQAEQIPRTRDGASFQATRPAARTVVPDVYRKAMAVVLQPVPARAEKPRPKSRLAPGNVTPPPPIEDKTIIEAKARAATALEARPGFASREDAVYWLHATLGEDPALENLVAAYEQEVNAELVSDADKLIDHSASLRRGLDRSEFQLLPEKWQGWKPTRQELPGLLIAVALLSMGAPFLYNTLKNIASLRPMLAMKLEQQEKQDKPA
jgi:hypothetical protein